MDKSKEEFWKALRLRCVDVLHTQSDYLSFHMLAAIAKMRMEGGGVHRLTVSAGMKYVILAMYEGRLGRFSVTDDLFFSGVAVEVDTELPDSLIRIYDCSNGYMDIINDE